MDNTQSTTIKKAWYKKWWVWVIAVVIIAAIGSNGNKGTDDTKTASNPPKENAQQTQTDTPAEVAPALVFAQEPIAIISASDFYEEYEENSLAADKKYKGELVVITGEAGSINKDILGKAYLTIDVDEWGISSIQCYFKNEDEILNIRKGDYIEVQGTVDNVVLIAPTIKNCTIK